MPDEGVSLKEHFEVRLQALEEAYKTSLLALKEAVAAANKEYDNRFVVNNEFRASLADLSALMATRNELEALKEYIEKDLRVLRESRAELVGKASQKALNLALALTVASLLIGFMGIVIGIVGIVIGIVGIVLKFL